MSINFKRNILKSCKQYAEKPKFVHIYLQYITIYKFIYSIMAKKKKQKQRQLTQQQKKALLRQRAFDMVDEVSDSVFSLIKEGQVLVNDLPKHIEKPRRPEPENKDICQKLSSLNNELTSLEQQIKLQKEQEKMIDDEKNRAARSLVRRLKKEKQEHKNEMKFDQLHNRLKMSAVSDNIIKEMKDHKQKIIKQKQKQMELRIYQNINRKNMRHEERIKNEVQYWTKVKQIQERKHYQSTKLLPTYHQQPVFDKVFDKQKIHKKHSQPKLEPLLGGRNLVIPRKGSQLSQKKINNSHQTDDYHDKVAKFLEKAKLRQQCLTERSPNYRSKVHSSVVKINFLQSDTNQQVCQPNFSKQISPTLSPQQIRNRDKILHLMNRKDKKRRKEIGDVHLKESISIAKRSLQRSLQEDKSLEGSSIVLKAKKIDLSKQKIDKMQDKFHQILSKIENFQMQKSQGLQLLVTFERRLDKANPEGIFARLKAKMHTFQKVSKIEESLKKKSPQLSINISRISKTNENSSMKLSQLSGKPSS